jgi:phytoene synthase
MRTSDSFAYCAAEVRRFDPDRYLASLFAPADRRGGLFALYAFNLEIAKTREVVSEPLIGRMRLQWWRERMDGIFAGAPPAHEVAAALAETVRRHGLARRHFDRLIDARETDLAETPIETTAALESYVEGSASSVVALALAALGASCDAAARPAGLAWGLTGLLRTIPFHARMRRLYLPADLLHAAGIGAEDVFALRDAGSVARVVESVAKTARTHLAEARSAAALVPPEGLPALLPLTLADAYLARLARRDYDVRNGGIEMSRPTRQIRLALAAWRRRV